MSQRLGIPLVFTGHSLGREKQRRLLAGGGDRQQIEQAYAISRRIEAEEPGQADLVITSTRQRPIISIPVTDSSAGRRPRWFPSVWMPAVFTH